MNKFKFYFIVISTLGVLFSCKEKDDTSVEAVRAYSTQYATDNDLIENYLKTHYIENAGATDDQDVKLSLIPTGGTQASIMTYLDLPTFPSLRKTEVLSNEVTYVVYYLILKKGDPVKGKTPSRIDLVLASYDGSYLAKDVEPKRFEYVPYPENYFDLSRTVVGWQEIFPLFTSGTIEPNAGANGPIYSGFGAGVMFLPSGLGYFNITTATIPAYSPLIFSFKLYDAKQSDQDGDKIYSDDEDLNGDGKFTNDDTDGDGIQNYLDTDDDGDGYLTKNEIKKPAITQGLSLYYPYNPIIDNPDTPEDETENKGIPDCSDDGTSLTRLRKHLDPSCH